MRELGMFIARHHWALWALYPLGIIVLLLGSFAYALLMQVYLRAKYGWLMRKRSGCTLDTFRAYFTDRDISPRVTEKIYHYFQARTRFPGFAVLPDDRIRWIYGLDDKGVGVVLDKLSGALQCGELDDADWFEGRRVRTIADLVIFFNVLRESKKRG